MSGLPQAMAVHRLGCTLVRTVQLVDRASMLTGRVKGQGKESLNKEQAGCFSLGSGWTLEAAIVAQASTV